MASGSRIRTPPGLFFTELDGDALKGVVRFTVGRDQDVAAVKSAAIKAISKAR